MTPNFRFLSLAMASMMWLPACGSDPAAEAGTAGSSATTVADHPPMAPLDHNLDDPAALEAALEKNPNHTPILMRLAELALNNGDAKRAAEHLRDAVAQDPSNREARLELGRALWEAGNREGAESETAALLEVDPNNVDALYNMGAIQANQGQKAQAVEYWSRAVAVDPASPSGQSAQNGLNILGGAAMSIPAIPEHQNVRRTDIPDIPAHRGVTQGQPKRIDSGTRQRIIEFATTQ